MVRRAQVTIPPDQELRSIFSSLGGPDSAILLELVPLLPEALLPRALEIALDIRYPALNLRNHLVEVLAKRIVNANPDVIRDVLRIARTNLLHNMETGASSALVCILAPVLREDELPTALQIANHIWELEERRDAFLVLAGCLPPNDVQAVLDQELERARGIHDRDTSSWILSTLIPYLTEPLLSKALEITLEIQQAGDRVDLLTELVPYLSGEKRRSAIEATLSAILSTKKSQWQAEVLVELEPYLSEPDLVEIALAAAEKIRDKVLSIQVLVILAGRLSDSERHNRATSWKKIAHRLRDSHKKAAALAQIAPLLSSEERPATLKEILEIARSLRTLDSQTTDQVESDWRYSDVRAGDLIDLARRLPEQERMEILEEALQEVQSVPDPDWCDEMMASIALLLPEPPPFPFTFKATELEEADDGMQLEVEREVSSAIRRIRKNPWYVDVVVDRLGLIPVESRAPIVSQTVEALTTISSEEELGDKIVCLAPYLEESHLEQVLTLARDIKDILLRSRALVALAKRFAQTKQLSMVDEALADVESMEDIRKYCYLLGELAPVLNQTQKREALSKALKKMRKVPKSDLAKIWWSLAPHFPPDLLPQAWILAKSHRNLFARADALAALAFSVPPEDRPRMLGDALQAILALKGENIRIFLVDGGLTLILPELLLRQAVSAVQKIKDDLDRADILAELWAELAGYAIGDERWSILRAALQESLHAAVPRGGGKKGRSNPETGSKSGQRASEILQNLPEGKAQVLLEEWLGTLSLQTQQEMASVDIGVGKGLDSAGKEESWYSHAKPPEHGPEELIGGPEIVTIRSPVDQPPPPGQTRVVNTGFALHGQPDQRLESNTPLAAGEYYYFWFDVDKLDPLSIEVQPSSIPIELQTKPVILHVVLYAFPNEIRVTPGADIGALELQVDGSAVVKRQPGGQAAPVQDPRLLETRLYFPVQAPDREGTFRLRCHIYYEQILIQARLIEAQVMLSPQITIGALQSKLDYSLAHSLRPEHLARLSSHRLSLMLNDNGDTTHTLRFLGKQGGKPKKYDAHLLPTELEIPMLNARKALWKVSWGDENPWDPENYPEQKYRYENSGFDLERLENDLISLAVSGYILYDAIIDKLTGGRIASDKLSEMMRAPGLVQIALRQSPSQVLPAALFYDYDLDTQAPHELCETFKAALLNHTSLENTPCFQGGCPTLDKDDADHYVCPSGFWGFRHGLGFPFSALPGTDLPPEIVVRGAPQMVVGVATNLDLVNAHLKALKNIRTDLGWHESEHRDEMLSMMKVVKPHLIYFYCHGGVTKDVPFLQMGSGNEYIEGSNLRSKHIFWDSPQPLVFVNGCHTSALDPRQVINLVQDFVATGGSGVVGTEITIFETLACGFAEEFMASFLKLHTSVGEAVRCARLKLLEKGNPLGLVYTPFVLPSLHLLE